jgi:hypothetical protein
MICLNMKILTAPLTRWLSWAFLALTCTAARAESPAPAPAPQYPDLPSGTPATFHPSTAGVDYERREARLPQPARLSLAGNSKLCFMPRPPDAPAFDDYQLMVAGDVFRRRYRESRELPKPTSCSPGPLTTARPRSASITFGKSAGFIELPQVPAP